MARQPPENEIFGPFIDPAEEPPGRFLDEHWQGPLGWCTRHGPAIVRWSLGAPEYVWNARRTDGERVDVHGIQPAGSTFRHMTADGIVHGAISIQEQEVLFAPLPENPSEDIDEEQRPLQQTLTRDEAFARDLRGSAFAAALYSILENKTFAGPSEGVLFAFGQRSAARFVAALRGGGEIYLDYAWGRGAEFGAEDRERVHAHLSRLGVRVASKA